MPTLPNAQDVRKAREQATAAVGDAVEQARTPLLAALGAGDLTAKAVLETVERLRDRVNERSDAARAAAAEMPRDLNELREKLDPAELRKLVDAYTETALQLYGYLAERGEGTLERLRAQPQVQRAWNQFETAQDRVEDVVEDARGAADDMLGKVARTSRSYGEKAARAAEEASEQTAEAARETADTVEDAGSEAAGAARSAGRRTANQASAARAGNGSGARSSSTGSSGSGQTGGSTRKRSGTASNSTASNSTGSKSSGSRGTGKSNP